MDTTAKYLFLMVGIVAVAGIAMLFIARGGIAGADAGITGMVSYDGADASAGDVVSAPVVYTERAPASPAVRTLTILAVSFLIGIAAYMYLSPVP